MIREEKINFRREVWTTLFHRLCSWNIRHAYFVLIYFSSINCSTCCSLIHDASAFFKYEAWQGRGEKEKKRKKKRKEKKKKTRGRDSEGKAHGGTVTRLLRCPGEIAMVIPSSLSESSLKQKLTFGPSTRNARPGNISVLTLQFSHIRALLWRILGKK